MTHKEFSDWFENSLKNDPSSWKIGTHTVDNGKLEIWIANRPYADFTIYYPYGSNRRLGNFWQRRRYRKLIDNLIYKKSLDLCKNS